MGEMPSVHCEMGKWERRTGLIRCLQVTMQAQRFYESADVALEDLESAFFLR